MTETVPTLINGRWEILLPEHRAHRAEWATGWEPERLASMHDHLKPGMTIIDVGAEEGDLPGLWSTWGCDVALIEPNPKVWPNMKAIWQANSLTGPVGCFVGFASDVTKLTPRRRGYDATGYPEGLWPACADGPVIADHGFAHLSQQGDAIPQVTLDDFADHCELTVDALTIDVEGSELRVLQGARRLLVEHQPLVWCSIHADRDWMRDQYGGADRGTVDTWMAGVGYEAEFLASDHETHILYRPPR